MPCAYCNSTLVLVEDKWTCPRCDNLSVLEKNNAIEAFRRVVTFLNNILNKHIQTFDTDRLALHVLWQREKFARSFFDTYQGFHLTKFMAFNALIKRLMTEKATTGGIAANEANTANLVNQFTDYVSIVGRSISVENGFYSVLFPEALNPRSTSEIEMVKNLRTVPNETYLPVMNTFRNNDILNDKEVEKRIQEQKALAEDLRKQVLLSGQKVRYTSDQIIENQYFVLNQLYCGLQKDRMFQRTFDLSSFVGFAPHRIMDFVNQFPLVEEVITSARVDDFLGRLQRSFRGIRPNLLKRKLVFSERNADIFPLFVSIGDLVHISHKTAFIVYLLLHPILYRDRFNEETEKRSLTMERREAQAVFEQNGFRYCPNLKDKEKHPTLEIDGIATRGGMMYVVECKGWDLKPLYEHAFRQSDLERDLKGIVDGKKFEMKDGRLMEKKRVSLLSKIQFVRQNMGIWGFNPGRYSDIRGLVVIRASPPIQEYKGVEMISITRVSSLS